MASDQDRNHENPYQAPAAVGSIPADPTPTDRKRTLTYVFAIVGSNVVWEVYRYVSAVSLFGSRVPPITLVTNVLFNVLLGILLPLWAAHLLGQGRRSGHWLLVAFFALQTARTLKFLVLFGPTLLNHPTVVLTVFRSPCVEVLLYGAATLWLSFSPKVRALRIKPTASAPS